MSAHKKLMEARIRLQNTKLQKTGQNKFAGYQYFELGDFLPTVQNIFFDMGLCGVISFGETTATLTITDIETDRFIEISSPMAEANLKGCHPIQNLGAAQTYLRRYLWIAAMEIVEHDVLDATTGNENKGKGIHKPTVNENFKPEGDELVYLSSIVDMIISNKEDYVAAADYYSAQSLDNDEKTWIWNKLGPYSKLRSDMKKYNASKLSIESKNGIEKQFSQIEVACINPND